MGFEFGLDALSYVVVNADTLGMGLAGIVFTDKKMTRFTGHPVIRTLGGIASLHALIFSLALIEFAGLLAMPGRPWWMWALWAVFGILCLRLMDYVTGRNEKTRTKILHWGSAAVAAGISLHVMVVSPGLMSREALIETREACQTPAARAVVGVNRVIGKWFAGAGQMAMGFGGLCRAVGLRAAMLQDRGRVCGVSESDGECLANVAIAAGQRHGWQVQSLSGMVLIASSVLERNSKSAATPQAKEAAQADTLNSLLKIAESVKRDPAFQDQFQGTMETVLGLVQKKMEGSGENSNVAAIRARIEALEKGWILDGRVPAQSESNPSH